MCAKKEFDHIVKTSFRRASSISDKVLHHQAYLSAKSKWPSRFLYKFRGLDFYTKSQNFKFSCLFNNKQDLEAGVFESVDRP